MSNLDTDVALAGRGHDGQSVFDRGSERLLDQHIQAAVDGCQREGQMGGRWRRHDDAVEIGLGDLGLVAEQRREEFEPAGHEGRAALVGEHHGAHHQHTVDRTQGRDVLLVAHHDTGDGHLAGGRHRP